MSKVSDKLNLIDQKTFDVMQKSNGDVTHRSPKNQNKIRNSKYKKSHKHVSFSIFDYVKVQEPKSKRCPRRVIIARTIVPIKKRGKKRESEQRRKLTKIKKNILRYREHKMKLLQQELESNNNSNTNTNTSSNSNSNNRNNDNSNNMMVLLEETMSGLTIHSRRFREYCDNCTTTRLSDLTSQLLRDLHRFQKRAFAINEIKARAHRRYILGFREIEMHLPVKKIKLVIIAPDCEPCKNDDGLDEKIASIKANCDLLEIPYLFSLRRRQLSHVFCKKVPISCVGVFDYDGAQDTFKQLIAELAVARAEYKTRTTGQSNS